VQCIGRGVQRNRTVGSSQNHRFRPLLRDEVQHDIGAGTLGEVLDGLDRVAVGDHGVLVTHARADIPSSFSATAGSPA
jgi:hypothetical protein